MLVFSAITPHPPLLIPAIGQDNLVRLKKTKAAMEKLAYEFYLAQPETAIIISPHGELMANAFTLNSVEKFNISFKKFGDFNTQLNFKGDVSLAYQIKEKLETKLPLQMISQSELDHGVGIPLYCLGQNMPHLKIIPLGYCSADLNAHFNLGQELAEIIQKTPKRIALIASGDLSHCLTDNAPAPYSSSGKKFDQALIDLIKNKKNQEILHLEKNLIEEAAECGLKSIAILLGAVDNLNFTPEILSYESPFGVGYLVCDFKLNR
jgi:AmmeMemoRadiSam system protein B